MPASRSQLSPDVYIKEAPLRESSDFMLFSHPHHLCGDRLICGGSEHFLQLYDQWSVPSTDDKLDLSKILDVFLQILFMSDDSPDSRCDYTPPCSNISQNQFLPVLPPQFSNVDKKNLKASNSC